MNKLYLVLNICFLMPSVTMFASQFAAKGRGRYDVKSAAHSMRVAPDRVQQRSQGAWEVLMARKAQTEQKAVVPICPHKYSLPCQEKSTEHFTTQESAATLRPHFRCVSASKNHNIALMTLFTLLCITPCAAFCDTFERPVTGGDAWSVCRRMTDYINLNRGTFEIIRAQGKKIHELDGQGVIDFLPVIEMGCPPDLDFHWRIDHSWDWYNKGRAFLDASCAKYQELNRRIDTYNKHVEEHNKLEQIKVDEHNKKVEKYGQFMVLDNFIGGKYYHLNPSYQAAFDAYIKDPDAYCSRAQQEFDNDPWVKLGAVANEYENRFLFEIKENDLPFHLKTGSKAGFLELMRAHDGYIDIAKGIIKTLSECTKIEEVKKAAQQVLANIEKGPQNPEYIATELDKLLKLTRKIDATDPDFQLRYNSIALLRLKARLDEQSRGLLYAGSAITYRPCELHVIDTVNKGQKIAPFVPGIRILCTPQGLCGISDAIAATLGGAKTNFVYADMHVKDMLGRVDSAQDLLRLVKSAGEYAGQPYVGNGPVNQLIRSIEGGDELASVIFQFLARGNKVKDSYSYASHTMQYKLVLDDGTKIIYYPPSAHVVDAIIVVSDMPSWISHDTIEFRFRPTADGEQEPSENRLYLQEVGDFSARDIKMLQKRI